MSCDFKHWSDLGIEQAIAGFPNSPGLQREYLRRGLDQRTTSGLIKKQEKQDGKGDLP
jgi:hypothetical protein